MLGTALIDRCMQDSLKINADLANGLALKQSKDIEMYVHEVLRCSAESYPPGLKYIGYRRATPDEQLTEETRQRRKRRTWELAKSDLYHCVYNFEFEGIPLKPRYIRLPFIRKGGIMRIRGSSYTIAPVIADKVFSVTDEQVFMPVTRSKITFFKEVYSFIEDDIVRSVNVVYSPIFNVKIPGDRHKRRRSLILHYLLAKLGMETTFKRYFNVDIQILDGAMDKADYPTKDWVHCRSRRIQPKVKYPTEYFPTNVEIMIPRNQYTPTIANTMGGVFYIIDHEPDMINVADVNNPMLWRRILPRFIKSSIGVEKKAMEEMESHIASLDAYIDGVQILLLHLEGIPCETIYDVFAYIIEMFPIMTMNSNPASMFGKRLETVKYIMFDVVASSFKLMFDLMKMSGNRLHKEGIERSFDQAFPTNMIERLKTGHGEISILETASDCLPLSITKTLVPQAKASVVGRRSKSSEMTNPAYALDASQVAVGTYLFISKSDPTAKGTINHFMQLGDQGEVLVEPEYLHELEVLNEAIKIK